MAARARLLGASQPRDLAAHPEHGLHPGEASCADDEEEEEEEEEEENATRAAKGGRVLTVAWAWVVVGRMMCPRVCG
jgi:hypothetical protein